MRKRWWFCSVSGDHLIWSSFFTSFKNISIRTYSIGEKWNECLENWWQTSPLWLHVIPPHSNPPSQSEYLSWWIWNHSRVHQNKYFPLKFITSEKASNVDSLKYNFFQQTIRPAGPPLYITTYLLSYLLNNTDNRQFSSDSVFWRSLIHGEE